MATKQLRTLYFAVEDADDTLLGWDAVDENTVSKYQAMLGSQSLRVYVIELQFPHKPIYEWKWDGWHPCDNKYKEYLPKEVQMRLLTGAL